MSKHVSIDINKGTSVVFYTVCEELHARAGWMKEHGGTLTYTDEGYRLDDDSEMLFRVSRPAKGGGA